MAVLENEYLRVSLLIDKGTDIFEFLYKPKDIDFMWLSPWGINDPSKFVPTINSKKGNFMDYYEGGWQELLPNFGSGYIQSNNEQGLHGEISLIPWQYQIISDSPKEVSIRFFVRTFRTPFYLEKTLTLKSNDPRLFLKERLINEGYAAVDFIWAHHPTFGGIFLDESTIIDIPGNKIKFVMGDKDELNTNGHLIWPFFKKDNGELIDFRRAPDFYGQDHSTDEACIGDLAKGFYTIENRNQKVGFGLQWDKEIFPYLWIWRMYGKGNIEPPWWGRVHCMAIEPCSGFSPYGLGKAVENGTVSSLRGQEEINTEIIAFAFENGKKSDFIL